MRVGTSAPTAGLSSSLILLEVSQISNVTRTICSAKRIHGFELLGKSGIGEEFYCSLVSRDLVFWVLNKRRKLKSTLCPICTS